jgi:hypothetical protein
VELDRGLTGLEKSVDHCNAEQYSAALATAEKSEARFRSARRHYVSAKKLSDDDGIAQLVTISVLAIDRAETSQQFARYGQQGATNSYNALLDDEKSQVKKFERALRGYTRADGIWGQIFSDHGTLVAWTMSSKRLWEKAQVAAEAESRTEGATTAAR